MTPTILSASDPIAHVRTARPEEGSNYVVTCACRSGRVVNHIATTSPAFAEAQAVEHEQAHVAAVISALTGSHVALCARYGNLHGEVRRSDGTCYHCEDRRCPECAGEPATDTQVPEDERCHCTLNALVGR